MLLREMAILPKSRHLPSSVEWRRFEEDISRAMSTQATTDDDCGDPAVLDAYKLTVEAIEASGDYMAMALLDHHRSQIEGNRDMSECQKDPRREALTDMWDRWGLHS